ncbi:MAG: hypothetical protein HYZ44_10610 [Bacteroidetes bacterium]|nr:hypothetical protein [Bacteroidota bacterium]
MKNIRASRKFVLTSILSIFYFALLGQNEKIDKRIHEIESYKKYDFINVDNKDELKILSDSITEVTAISYSLKKTKNDNIFGKMIVNSKTDSEEIKRTFYLDERSGLFAIVDSIKRNDKVEKRTYYFSEEGELLRVIDQNGGDLTSTVNSKQLAYSIKLMFTKLIQQKYLVNE